MQKGPVTCAGALQVEAWELSENYQISKRLQWCFTSLELIKSWFDNTAFEKHTNIITFVPFNQKHFLIWQYSWSRTNSSHLTAFLHQTWKVCASKTSHTLLRIEYLRGEPSLRYQIKKTSDVMEAVLTWWKLLGAIIIDWLWVGL